MQNTKLHLPLSHHSASDWDFSIPTWTLSPAKFVSPPSALKATAGVVNVLSNLAPADCLPEGRLVSYINHAYGGHMPGFIFRVQHAEGSIWAMSRYYASHDPGANWILQRFINGTATITGFWYPPITLNTWYHWRLTWWNGETPERVPALVIKLEREEGGSWVDYGNLFDVDNMWADSEVNRLGICVYGTACYFDDTEIWVPCP